MQLSGDNTNFNVSPLIGYRITQPWSAGLQFYYSYNNNDSYRQNGYGGGVFTRYDVNMPAIVNRIFPAMHFHAEYDYIKYQTHYKYSNTDGTSNYNMLPLGLGIYLGSGRSRVGLTVLWDMLHLAENGGTPTLRIGVIF